VRLLSGGERNRLLLAKLFTRPSNLLVMDEPTNDLDAETLELLEERLMDYPGTVIIVSHDRAFLNNVVTSTIALEGAGRVAEYVGGYDDWLRQRPAPAEEETKKSSRKARTPGPKKAVATSRKKRSFGEERELAALEDELAALPGKIETVETAIAATHKRMADPEFYKRSGEEIGQTKEELAALEQELEQAFARWEAVETRLEELHAFS
jgi:ATP-binding cassette subfamily F protein uup